MPCPEPGGGNETPFQCRGKARRGKAAALKRRNASKAKRSRGVSIAGQETVVARLTDERDEALLRETANSEILQLIFNVARRLGFSIFDELGARHSHL